MPAEAPVLDAIWWQSVLPDAAALNEACAHSMQGHLGIELIEFTHDSLSARMPVDARTHQPFGRLHGGASVVLAETLGSLGALHTIDRTQFMAVGLEINANHIRPVKEGWVYATARPESRGRTTQIWSIRVVDENDKLVCISRFTAAIIPLERN